MSTLFENQAPRPLADRLRPKSLADVVGQDHLLGPDGPIGRMMASRQLSSMILWGPPGCGKTTVARLLAHCTDLHFEPLSAVFSGVADLRKVFDAARKRREMDHGAVLDHRQKRVLLGAVEAVDLVDEEERAVAHLAPLPGRIEHLPQVGNSGKDRR